MHGQLSTLLADRDVAVRAMDEARARQPGGGASAAAAVTNDQDHDDDDDTTDRCRGPAARSAYQQRQLARVVARQVATGGLGRAARALLPAVLAPRTAKTAARVQALALYPTVAQVVDALAGEPASVAAV